MAIHIYGDGGLHKFSGVYEDDWVLERVDMLPVV